MAEPSKVHPTLAEQLEVHAAAHSSRPLHVIVLFRKDVSDPSTVLKGSFEPIRSYHLLPAVALTVDPKQVEEICGFSEVELVWYDEPVHTMLDSSASLIGASKVWQEGITGRSIKVGIMDTGIDPKHPDLRGRIAQMKDFTGQGPADHNGHGTHVAGIIGGAGEARRGVAPDCFLLSAKVLCNDGSGFMRDVIAGIEWATVQQAQVINLSLGGDIPSDGSDGLSAMCEAAGARGVVVCVAAGNAGPGTGTIASPAAAKSVITVGATTKEDLIWDSSSRGPTSDGRVKPDVCSPGVDIVSCRAKGTYMGKPIDGSYTVASGTSAAVAHVSGACALILQANPSFTSAQVKEQLASKARKLYREPNAEGRGRLELAGIVRTERPVPEVGPEGPPRPEDSLAEQDDEPRSSGWRELFQKIVEGR